MDLLSLVTPASLLTVAGFIWRSSARNTRIETKLDLVLSNHLPHIYDELKELRQLVFDQKGR